MNADKAFCKITVKLARHLPISLRATKLNPMPDVREILREVESDAYDQGFIAGQNYKI